MLPAYAGMIRHRRSRSPRRKSAPRVCGDDPDQKATSDASHSVLPAYAGMIPAGVWGWVGVVLAVFRGNLVVAGVSWVGCALVLPLSGVALGVVPHTVGAWTKLLGFKPLRWNFPGPGR